MQQNQNCRRSPPRAPVPAARNITAPSKFNPNATDTPLPTRSPLPSQTLIRGPPVPPEVLDLLAHLPPKPASCPSKSKAVPNFIGNATFAVPQKRNSRNLLPFQHSDGPAAPPLPLSSCSTAEHFKLTATDRNQMSHSTRRGA